MNYYTNPILPGFYPDPSICKKGDDYYMVTSSFEFFPGVPIFHSKDLVNWEQIGHCLTRKSQLDLDQIQYSKGIYAPTIRHNPHDDMFYMVTTNVSKIGNFFVSAKDPKGEWSEPVLVAQGGIDPSLFFDDDGSAHFISNARDRSVYKSGFYMSPIDLKTGKLLQEPTPLWGGIGEMAPEAPHIYKINGWYYQMIAEGGTELGHMVTIARSKTLYGTYEPCPFNPILTHKHRKGHLIQGTGHADLIEDNFGNWWAVFLGFRMTHQYFHHLGRETFLAPVQWVDGWPLINNGNSIETKMELPVSPPVKQQRILNYETDFSEGIDFNWVYLRNPNEANYHIGKKGLLLYGNAHTLSDVRNPAFLGFRQSALSSEMQVEWEFSPSANNEEAGISVFYKYDAHLDVFVAQYDNVTYLCYRKVVGDIVHLETKLPIQNHNITVKIISTPLTYQMFAIVSGAEIYLGQGLTRYVSTEAHELGFTGTFYALYATGNGKNVQTPANFKRFLFKNMDV